MPQRLAETAAPVAIGSASTYVAWFDLLPWWELGTRTYSVLIGLLTLAYVFFRAANEYRRWRDGRAPAGDS